MRYEIFDAHNQGISQRPLVGKPWATGADEIRWLLTKAEHVPGNILEVGVFHGETTLEFARAYPKRLVYALDLKAEDIPKFFREMSVANICEAAKNEPNVRLLLQGRDFEYTESKNIGFVFIDGDHSWEGVRYDTEKALRWFRPSGRWADKTKARQGIIAWHDAVPAWPGDFNMQVYTYLLQLSVNWPVTHVKGTTLCYLNL